MPLHARTLPCRSPRFPSECLHDMIPHDPIQRARGPVQTRQSRPGPSHSVLQQRGHEDPERRPGTLLRLGGRKHVRPADPVLAAAPVRPPPPSQRGPERESRSPCAADRPSESAEEIWSTPPSRRIASDGYRLSTNVHSSIRHSAAASDVTGTAYDTRGRTRRFTMVEAASASRTVSSAVADPTSATAAAAMNAPW